MGYNWLLTFANYHDGVRDDSNIAARVTLMLQNDGAEPWPLTLSADCLRFVGRYQRLDGFDIHAALRVGGIDRRA